MKRKLLTAISALVIAWVVLVVSDNRILLSETKVEPGQRYVLREWGNVGDAQQASLVCKYFTGRAVKASVYWYSPNNFMGKDHCPFIARD